MDGTKNYIRLRLVFVTLLAVNCNLPIAAAGLVRYLGKPSPTVNVSNGLLRISKWYCSKLVDEDEWDASESIINNYVAADNSSSTLPTDMVKSLKMCENFQRGDTNWSGTPYEAEPEDEIIEQPTLVARVVDGIGAVFSYPFKWFGTPVSSSPTEVTKRPRKNDTQLTKDEVMNIVTLLPKIVEQACDKQVFPLQEKSFQIQLDIIKTAVQTVKDDGFLEELTHVREGLEKCLEGTDSQYWEPESERKEHIERAS